MNVKKEQLREDIRTFISEHPNSAIRTIAEHFDLQKHSLYYHMKILLKDDVISVTHTEIVNGIDKKYYSVRQTPAQAPDWPQNATNSGTAEAAAVFAPKPAAPDDVQATQPEATAAAPENTASDVKKSAKKEDSIDDQAATLSNLLLNVKNNDSAPPEKTAESSPEQVQTAPQEPPAEQPQKQQNKPVEESSKAPAEKKPIKEVIEPRPVDPKAGKTPQQTIIQDLTKNKTAKKKKFNIKFNPNFNLSSLFKRKKKKKKTKTLSERYQKWVAGMRERNVFNLDIFDTFRSRSLLISRNAIISFENKEDQNTFQIIDKEQLPDLINNKRNRIAVIDEDLLDNHEKIQSPLKKKNDQELFLNKFITRKYGISNNDLFLTYEVFGTEEKNEYELNTIFTKKSYIDPFLDLLDTEKKIPANIYFMSFAGIFSRYNQQVLKDHNYNLYVYAGKKDCVVTLLYRGKILSHRKILISNRGLDRKTYRREVHNRLIKTIDIFIQEYAIIDETFTALNQILFCGPNLSKDIVDEVSDKFKVSCNLIEGSFPSSGDEGNFNDYIPTLKVISRSLANLGKNQYVFDQSKKKLFRLNRIKKVVAYASLALLLLLSGLNVNDYERKTASAFVLSTQTDAVNATIDLIKDVENNLQNNIQLSHFDNYLNNIHTNKQNVKKILLLMNSDIFKHLEIRNIKIETSGHEEIDAKKQKIYLSCTINDYKPEALLETQNIQNALSDIGFLTNVELNTLHYAQGRLPLNITMEIVN